MTITDQVRPKQAITSRLGTHAARTLRPLIDVFHSYQRACAPAAARCHMVTSGTREFPCPSPRTTTTWGSNHHHIIPQQITKLVFVFLKLSILPVALRDLKLSSQRSLQELLSSSSAPPRRTSPSFQPSPKPNVLHFLHVLRDAITALSNPRLPSSCSFLLMWES